MTLINELTQLDELGLANEVEGASANAPLVDVVGGLTFNAKGAFRGPELSLAYVRDLTSADLAILASGVRAPSVRDRLDALTHRHHLAARMIADGMPTCDVAYATAYSGDTISHLRSDPAFGELVSYYAGQKEQVYLDVHQRLGSLGMAAVDKLQQRIGHLDELGNDPQVDAKAEAQRKIMPNGTLLQIAEMALDRSLAPSKGQGGADARGQGNALGSGLVVNLNFGEPQRSQGTNPMVDITPNEDNGG